MSIVWITLSCLLISIVWNILFWDRSYGISMPVFTAVVILFLLWVRRIALAKTKLTLFIHVLLLVYLSICAACFRNNLIRFAAIPTIYLGLVAVAFAGRFDYKFANCLGVLETLIKKIFGSVFAGAGGLIGETLKKLTGDGKSSRTIFKILIGILVSLPFLIAFTWLFTSADPIFENYLKDILDFIWKPEFFKRSAVIAFMWFLFCGYIAKTNEEFSLQSHLDRTQPKLNYDGTIVFVFLLMNNILFLAFIIIQLEYLFGGAKIINNTSYTYAEYAHRGFYELWAAVFLISIIIIYTDYRLREQTGNIRRLVELAWIAMIVQTCIIIASAFKRILVYEEAYGYTYLRILVALFQLWMAGTLLLFIFKIIRRKSLSWLISGGLCLAFIFLIFVSTFSIDSFIARKNIDRYLYQGKELDTGYLTRLSTDAYPQIVRLQNEAKDELIRQSAENIRSQMKQTAQKNLKHWASCNLSLSKSLEGGEGAEGLK